MPHKLFIEFEIGTESTLGQYVKLLEVIKGDRYKIRLFVTNLGTSVFPGSDAIEIEIHYRTYGMQQSGSYPDEVPSCPEIKPGNKVEVFSDEFTALDEGTAWITAKMKAKDGQDIKYYQSPTSELRGDLWQNWFFVLSREYSYLVAKLDEILKELK